MGINVPTIRKIVESSRLAKIVELPAEMKNTKVEITVRSINKKENEIYTFDPKKYRGLLNIENVHEQIEQIRSEWERL